MSSMGSSLRGPARRGATDIDEGSLTESVIRSYSSEDGTKGQQAAAAVLPARQHLWRCLEDEMPKVLAAAIRSRAESDLTVKGEVHVKGGVHELRLAVAGWLDPLPHCRACGENMTENPRWCSVQPVPKPVEDEGFTWFLLGTKYEPIPEKPKKPRRRRCVASKARYWGHHYHPHTNKNFRLALGACTLRGTYDVVVDRDARILFELSDPKNEALSDATKAARKNLDRAMNTAVKANGRLILKTQLKFYSGCGSVARADLLQGGGMGCRRALLDYDASQASFASYAINWIRQGMGEIFGGRETIKVPPDVSDRRKKFDALGLDSETTLAALDMAAFGHPEDLIKILTPFSKCPEVLNREIVRLVFQAKKKKVAHSTLMESVAGWCAKILGQKWGGAALLSSLRYGGTHSFTTPGEPDDVQEFQSLVLVAEDQEETWIMEQEHAWNHQRFLMALSDVHLEEPEAAEVLRRYHGMDGLEEETYLDISKAPLRSTGRQISRETIRKLGERGQRALEIHLQAEELPAFPTTPQAPKEELGFGPKTILPNGVKVMWPVLERKSAPPKKTKPQVVKPPEVLVKEYHELCDKVSSIRW